MHANVANLNPIVLRHLTHKHDPESKRWCRIASGIPAWVLEYTTRGSEDVLRPSGRTDRMEAGHALLIKPGTPLNFGQSANCKEWNRYFCLFAPRGHWEALLLDWPELYPGAMRMIIPPRLRKQIAGKFQKAADICRSAWELQDQMVMNIIEDILLWCHTINPNSRQASMDARIRNAMHFISRHFPEPLTVEEIGRHVGMSRARFIRQFHQETGGTPRRFIESCRIEEAIWLLHARNLSVSEIAYACGFQDPARFSRVFKARTGKSPSDLRRPGPGGASLD